VAASATAISMSALLGVRRLADHVQAVGDQRVLELEQLVGAGLDGVERRSIPGSAPRREVQLGGLAWISAASSLRSSAASSGSRACASARWTP
jgi:hypothetical protein